jgi:hypothetical protein
VGRILKCLDALQNKLKLDTYDRMNSNPVNVSTEDFPVIGTLIMVVVFVYAWIADTSERKEAFTSNMEPPSRIETFYGGPPLVAPKYQAYAE